MEIVEGVGLVYGTIAEPGRMYLRQHCGEATNNQTGDVFEMSTNMYDGSPIIYCPANGRYWTIGWDELIGLAEQRGLSKAEASSIARKPKEEKSEGLSTTGPIRSGGEGDAGEGDQAGGESDQ